MLTGQNGILNQAQNAKKETEQAAEDEAAALYQIEEEMGKAIGGETGGINQN